ncbi:DUF262 domain-containing protein [bacterium]|nr:DUF262 domain-containing protein [bacterium]
MNIHELLEGIEKLDMVLPEFQREYVWEKEQAKQLLVSLYKGYPTGSLLFWKTDNPPDIKNDAVKRDKIGTTMVILDGQQRLTTLYLLIKNRIPPFYKEEEIKTDPRNLYFDVETGDFMYYQPKIMENNPTWLSVTGCFDGSAPSIFEIVKLKLVDQDESFKEESFKLAEKYNQNLNNLKKILDNLYPVQYVPSDAGIYEAIDVFDKVNSMGTKLSDAELALAHICGEWPQARKEIKRKIKELEKLRFKFDLSFMVRALTGVIIGRGLFETIHKTPKDDLKAGWKKLNNLLDFLINILVKHAYIHSTEDLNTNNVLVPPIVYLGNNGGTFNNQKDINLFVHWLYAASTWARYTGQTDQRLDQDISIIVRIKNPWKELEDNIIDQRGRIDLKESDIDGRGIQQPVYRMTHIIIKRKGAVDWFNGSPLDTPIGSSYAIHSHHIFPSSVLYNAGGYNSENHLHKKIVNEIANRAFLSSTSNISLSNELPENYLPEIRDKYPDAIEKQLIPADENLWKLDRYKDFLKKRRELIAQAYNELMDSLLKDIVHEESFETLIDLLKAGESATLEFKSTLRWDVREKQVNKNLQKVIVKSIAGFMNTGGGILLIGVADDGSIHGIEDDMNTLRGQNRDSFELSLVDLITHNTGAEYSGFIRTSFEEKEEKTVCIIKIESSPKPVYINGTVGKEFYIRTGNSTRQLDPHATYEYIGMHWRD